MAGKASRQQERALQGGEGSIAKGAWGHWARPVTGRAGAGLRSGGLEQTALPVPPGTAAAAWRVLGSGKIVGR